MSIIKSTFLEEAETNRRRTILNNRMLASDPLEEERHRLGLGNRASFIVVDVELTNRCNARCDFCPRDKTPHQGHMSEEIFMLAIDRIREMARTIESTQQDYEVKASFCGLGEPCLHPNLPDYIARLVEAGINPGMASNASLLTETLSHAILDAGLRSIYFNVSELYESYNDVYGIDFSNTVANIERFNKLAAGRCHVFVVVTDHRMDPEHVLKVKQFWKDRGVTMFFNSALINRAGAAEHKVLNFENHREESFARSLFGNNIPGCIAPVIHTFVSYDGTYYLCNSDWERQAPAGTVFDRSILESMARRLTMTKCRDDNICRNCSHDPLNQIMRMRAAGASSEALAAAAAHHSEYFEGSVGFMDRCFEGGWRDW